MIEIRMYPEDVGAVHRFKTKECALRFMYAMRGKGYLILGWTCDDTCDNNWLERRFKL